MTDYSKLKVVDLKALVKDRGIASAGLKVKQNFIDALEADDASNSNDENGQGISNESVPGESEDVLAPPEPAALSAPELKIPIDVPDTAAVANETDTQVNESPQSESSIMNKRKRRSTTPRLTEEIVHKKLKTAEANANNELVVKLPEDEASTTDNAPLEKPLVHEDSENAMELDKPEDTTAERLDDPPPAGPPSKHPPTRAIYIKELVRPLQIAALRDHISSVAKLDDTISPPGAVEFFHLDKLRSHAFVRFDSIAAACKARLALHDKIWPDEPMRKPLWVDFVPEQKVQDWIEIEDGRNDMTRWEVVYDADVETDGQVVASLREVEASAVGARRPSSNDQSSRQAQPPGTGQGMLNAPSGPRQRSTQLQPPPEPPAVEAPKPAQSSSFNSLDQLYHFTESKPKIYYQPVSRDLAQRRQEEFDRETSHNWVDADADPSAYGEGELRRYTFEDGDRLVDGGADFGLFGRRGRGGGPPRGGRGRGGGGDYYRGGNRWR